jgi:hypothetical protein
MPSSARKRVVPSNAAAVLSARIVPVASNCA